MRRSLPVILLLLAALPVLGFSLTDWKSSLDDNVRVQAENSFSDLFRCRVRIREAGGIILGHIILKDMTIPGIGRAPTVILDYNPIEYAMNKGDMVPALNKLTFIGATMNLLRDKSGRWNVSSLVEPSGDKPAAPPPFRGQIIITNCQANYLDEAGFRPAPQKFSAVLKEVNGVVDLRKKNQVKFLITGQAPESVKTQGNLDMKTGKYLVTVTGKDLSIDKWGNYAAPLPDPKALSGKADINIKFTPAVIEGDARVYNGKIYGQAVAGPVSFSFQDSELTATSPAVNLYRGSASAKADLSFKNKVVRLKASAKLSGIDLAALAQNAPGIEGRAGGLLELSGPLNDLKGTVTADLARARVFGQPMQNITTAVNIKDGDVLLERFKASAGSNFLSLSGKIGHDLAFNLRTEAVGLRLSGRGLLGKQAITIDKFNGDLAGMINAEFLAAPLKKLYASGEAALSNGQIGQQLIDRADGKIEIGGGLIKLEESYLRTGDSILHISGQTGFGFPTNLIISGARINAGDLKILNHFLPPEAQDPQGMISIEVAATGTLSKETQMTSFDPLLDLTVNGRLVFSNAVLAGIPFNARAGFSWQEHVFSLSRCRLDLRRSYLILDLSYGKTATIDGSLEGIVDLAVLQDYKINIGETGGLVGFAARFQGSGEDPLITAAFWINKLHFNEINLDSVSGSAYYARNRLTLLKPLQIIDAKNTYALSGTAEVFPEDLALGGLALTVKVKDADLNSAYRLFDKVRGEVASRISTATAGKLIKISQPLALSLAPRGFSFYSSKQKDNLIFKWKEISAEAQRRITITPEENIGGTLNGSLRLAGTLGSPECSFEASVVKGYFRAVTFDKLAVSGGLDSQQVRIDKAVLSKDWGKTTVRGHYDFAGKTALSISAANMPLSVFNAFLPLKVFKGGFNANATVDGPIANPNVNLAASGQNITLAGNDFDRAALSLNWKNGALKINEFSLLQGKLVSSLEGSLASDGRVNLDLHFYDNAIGLLNLFTDDVRWAGGNSALTAEVTGTLNNPRITGALNVSNGRLYLRALESDLQGIAGTASINNNLLQISRLTAVWQGKRTRDYQNPLGLAGSIDLNNLFSENRGVDLNLAVSPTRLYVNFPGLFTGGILVDALSLQGPYYLDASAGPLLAGKVRIEDAVITIPQGGGNGSGGKAPPIRFDLDADINRNVYAVMGDVATLNLSNILMNLEVTGQGFKIAGDLATPSLLGKIFVKRGTLSIFNRDFNLLNTEEQKKYYPFDPEKVQDNTAVFLGEQGPAGVMPKINVTAQIDVEDQEKASTGEYIIIKKVAILARLQGMLGARDQARGLRINLSGFTEDKTKAPSEMTPAAYSEYDLQVLLLPDFIRSLAGLNQQGEKTTVDTNVIVADYMTNRMQSMLFRGLERQLERGLGLESLTLEYNFGPQLKEAMGIQDNKGYDQEDKPAWTVGFVKGFFDRLYIDVRYSQSMEQTNGSPATTMFNYQLTYKLSPIWSIIYFREPMSLNDIATGYQKVTLKAGFAFW